MARLKSYQKDTSISADDKVIGSDSTGVTRNYLISDLANFIHGEGGTYVHTQNSASTTWTINHNLGRFPSVSIKFSSSDNVYTNVQAFAGVVYNSNNQITINLAAAESGFAYLN